MADWASPQLSSTYTVFRQALNDRLVDAALMFDSASTSATNIPAGAKRWNSAASKFEKYDGSAWSDLASLYAINISGNATTATTAATANGLASGVALANLGNKSITYAKMQDVSASNRLLGRTSAGVGAIEEMTIHQMLDWFTTSHGSIIFRGGAYWTALPAGAAGNVLMSGGAGTSPYWGTISLSGYATTAYVASYFASAIAPYATTSYVDTKVSGYKRIAAGYGGVGTSNLVQSGNSFTVGTLYTREVNGISGSWRCMGRSDTIVATSDRIYLFEREA